MFRAKGLILNKRAVVLYMVLATILIVALLASILLNLTLSQSRLTHHGVSRIQAYYAAKAGIVYAMEQLRSGGSTNTSYNLSDSDFPSSVVNKQVAITVTPYGNGTCTSAYVPSSVTACVSSKATFTYSIP
jgi:Tfp pilus assembly protein PilX